MSRHFILATLVGILPAIAACTSDSDVDDLAFDESAVEGSGLDESSLEAIDESALEAGGEAEALGEAEAADELAAFDELLADPAQATEVKDKDGKEAEVWFTDLGLTLYASGKLKKLDDKKDVYIQLDAKAKGVASCTNPGGHDPPGQNPKYIEEVDVSGTDLIPHKKISKDGEATFGLKTKAPPKRVHGAPDCPNKKWKETLKDLKFKRCTITVKQHGKKDFTIKCKFEKPTENGPVPKKDVDCKSD